MRLFTGRGIAGRIAGFIVGFMAAEGFAFYLVGDPANSTAIALRLISIAVGSSAGCVLGGLAGRDAPQTNSTNEGERQRLMP